MNQNLTSIDFFDIADIDLLKRIGKTEYRSEDKNTKDAKQSQYIAKKVEVWSELSTFENLEVLGKKDWQNSGQYRDYIWRRIYRKGDSGKILFNLFATGEGLMYRLDCLRDKKAGIPPLTKEDQKIFDKYLKRNGITNQFVNKEELLSQNWLTLVSDTQNFIQRYFNVYDELESMFSNENIVLDSQSTYSLVETDVPSKVYSRIQQHPTFKGVVVNWSAKANTSKILGLAGEELVIKMEKEKLKKLGKNKLAKQVEKVNDGCGYDIRSYNEKEDIIYIEVKTTTGNENVPFYMSLNEKRFLEEYSDNYFVYRLYNFNLANSTAKFYKLGKEERRKLNFNSIKFEVTFGE